MKRLTRAKIIAASIVFLILVVSAVVTTEAIVGGYQLHWFSIDGGGGASSGGGYSLGGTAGQADAGTLSDGDYTVSGGFWAWSESSGHTIYLPLTLKG